jgi:2-keto-4-pentenoate hydratase/2-oxohepta-3-ene-1,7-dioic acid hydratase in catechol pathway
MSKTTLHPKDIGTLYCVGRNYAAHAKELNNPIPKEPVIFTKTRSSFCQFNGEIALPLALGRCDHETEVIIRIDKDLFNADQSQVLNAISHYGMALDLTLRDKQTELKNKGHSWDLAKSFTNACTIAPLLTFDNQSLSDISFSLTINGQTKQQGNCTDMLFSIIDLVIFISKNIPLMAGDMILTGTPEGVGPLNDQDTLQLFLNGQLQSTATIVRK